VVKLFDTIDERLAQWIEAQPVWFVSTAPLAADGHVNVSPRGHDTLSVLGPKRVGWVDYTGSGVETTRAVITVDVTRISDSCGYGVPVMEVVGERDLLRLTAEKKGPDGMARYRADKNALSIDGLPGL
jgi:predicted pyridoxine 5'-phosphate oxidase superfamily flavin-nucleotide-binding protein